MDRRRFFKTSALSLGAVAANDVPVFGKKKVDLSTQRILEPQGWIEEPARRIPVADSADVVVVGGGPAGVAAALSAARQGCSVCLVERSGFLGGLWTGGLVLIVWCVTGHNRQGKDEQVIFGAVSEIVERLQKLGMVDDPKQPTPDPEAAKYVMAELLEEAGVKVLYHSVGAGLMKSGDRIDSLLLETKSGRIAIRGKMFVDATGDGDLMEWAQEDYYEIKYQIGLNYLLGNMDSVNKEAEGFQKQWTGLPTPVPSVNWVNVIGPKEQDALDVFNTSRLQYQLRKEAWENTEALKKKPGYENVFLQLTAPLLGCRAARILNSRHNITLEESMTYASFSDAIGMSGAWTDVPYKDGVVARNKRPYWQIPLSSLVPKKTQNLLVAGRCFGFERGLLEDAREIGTCFVTGQGAGAAAAQAVLQRTNPADLDIKKLHAALKSLNVRYEM